MSLIHPEKLLSFFNYANERERIRIRRAAGHPFPLTPCWILQNHRFCNIFREDDTTTMFVKEHIRDPLGHKPRKLLLALLVARLFNRKETIAIILPELTQEWNPDVVFNKLKNVEPLVTGSFVVSVYRGMTKLQGIIKVAETAIQQDIEGHGQWLYDNRATNTLENIYFSFLRYKFIGNFNSYEITTDLRHTAIGNQSPDIMTWANPGPGAYRGLSRMIDLGKANRGKWLSKSSQKCRELAYELMKEILKHSQNPFYWGFSERPWEMREVEHTLCEYDKYIRVQEGGKTKQNFTSLA